jgi:hypothetical protein
MVRLRFLMETLALNGASILPGARYAGLQNAGD